MDILPLGERGKGYWLLARRSLTNPGEVAHCICYGPMGTTLEGLARASGTRWAIEECFEEAKGQSPPLRGRGVGLDQYDVRRLDGWHWHATLAMMARAYLCMIEYQAMQPGEKGVVAARMKC